MLYVVQVSQLWHWRYVHVEAQVTEQRGRDAPGALVNALFLALLNLLIAHAFCLLGVNHLVEAC